MTTRLPRIALTLGDVAGIGPEVVLKACASSALWAVCQPVIVGNGELLRRTQRVLKIELPQPLVEVGSPDELKSLKTGLPVWDSRPHHQRADLLTVPLCQIHPAAGRAAYDWLIGAIDTTLSGAFHGITTAPLNKAALHAAGVSHPGHTEILAERCGVREHAMMLYLPPRDAHETHPAILPHGPFGLGVAHVTLHTSVRSVPEMLSAKKVTETIELVDRFLKQLGCDQPRIAACALNPHAGEGGLFGDEESRIIQPGIDAAQQNGMNVVGPFPADTLMRRALYGEFDGVVAMYHDQGHIALKLAAWHQVVNVTLGLPIVRTSPSHGTGFDIAGRGIADPGGFLQAVQVAAKLAGRQSTT